MWIRVGPGPTALACGAWTHCAGVRGRSATPNRALQAQRLEPAFGTTDRNARAGLSRKPGAGRTITRLKRSGTAVRFEGNCTPLGSCTPQLAELAKYPDTASQIGFHPSGVAGGYRLFFGVLELGPVYQRLERPVRYAGMGGVLGFGGSSCIVRRYDNCDEVRNRPPRACALEPRLPNRSHESRQ